MESQGQAMREMPRYKCHKEVWALRIRAISFRGDGRATITPFDDGFREFTTEKSYVDSFKGDDEKDGGDLGYYVTYKGGYVSWSPAEAFEDGYTKVN